MRRLPSFYEQTPGEIAVAAGQLKLAAELLYSDQRMGELSGGEKIKIQLVRLLLGHYDGLLLDEPSNDLDLSSLQWLERFIRESAVPVLYISHDEVLLENTANKIIHLEQLRRKQEARATVEKSGYSEYVANRTNSFAKQEQMARKERADYDRQQERFRQIYQKVEHRQNIISRQDPGGARLLKKSMHRLKAYEARFEKEYENMTQLPESEEAIFVKFGEKASVSSGKVVLDMHLPYLTAGMDNRLSEKSTSRLLAGDVKLYVRGPEKICIVGHNGCGKSTLLRTIAAKLLNRTDIKAAYMPQNYEELLDMRQTPVEYLADTGSKEEITRIRTYLGSMKYTVDEMSHSIADLSGGRKAKILLLKLSMSGSNVLLLDEPTRNFSPLSNPVIRRMLRDYGGTIISVSHDRKYIREVADKVYELTENGLKLRNDNSLQRVTDYAIIIPGYGRKAYAKHASD